MLISCNSKNATIEGFEIVGTIEMNSQGEVVGDLSNAQPGDVLAGWRLGGNSGHVGTVNSNSNEIIGVSEVPGNKGVINQRKSWPLYTSGKKPSTGITRIVIRRHNENN